MRDKRRKQIEREQREKQRKYEGRVQVELREKWKESEPRKRENRV